MITFVAQDFVKALASPEGLPLPIVPLVLTGLAKPSTDAAGSAPAAFDFSPGTTCKLWVRIPTVLIDKIDHLGKMACQDHQHVRVRVHFVDPKTDEGKVLAELLKQLLGLDGVPSPLPESPSSLMLAQPMAEAFGWHPPPIHPPHIPPIHPPNIPNPIHNVRCAQCIAINMALAFAVTAAVAALGPEIGAATAVSSLMAQFGISQAVAIAAVAGASGALISKMMSVDKHVC